MIKLIPKTGLRMVALAVTAAALFSAPAQACPRSADRALSGASLGQDMVVNGLPVQIQQVSARESSRTVVDRVEAAWRGSGYEVKRLLQGPWIVVSALSDECLATLQLIERGESFGFFAISQPNKARPAVVKRDLPLPPGAQVVSTVTAKDGARASTTTTVAAKSSVNDTRDHFLSGLTNAGWASVRAHGLRQPGSLKDAQVLSAQRGAEMVQVVIFTVHGGTTAIISRAESL